MHDTYRYRVRIMPILNAILETAQNMHRSIVSGEDGYITGFRPANLAGSTNCKVSLATGSPDESPSLVSAVTESSLRSKAERLLSDLFLFRDAVARWTLSMRRTNDKRVAFERLYYSGEICAAGVAR